MMGSTNRAARRKALKRAKTSAMAGAAAAALTVGLAGAPSANAAIPLNIDIDPAYTAGTLAGILDFLGNAFPGTDIGGIYNSGPPATVSYGIGFPYVVKIAESLSTDVYLNILATLFLQNIRPTDTQSLYNTIAAIPQQKTGCGGTSTSFGQSNPATSCRFTLMLGTSEATLNLANAYRTQIESVTTGQTPAGYIPFQATAGSTPALPTQTNQALAFLQNPLRPNGGFLSRFPGFSEFLGQDPSMPAAGLYKSEDETVTVNTTTVDATWAYDPTADFPVVFNIFSILNSLNAFLPINLVGGLDAAQPFVFTNANGTPAEIQDVGLSLASLFQVAVTPVPLVGTVYLPMEPGKAYYATIVPKQLPLFSGMRLPSLILNAALGALNAPFRFGTPLSDALEPAFKILVNIGYDDVVTPEMIANDPATYGKYQPYDRTFLNSGVVTPFGSVDPLTPEEQSQVAGDVFQALISGFGAQFAKPFWGIIEPANPAPSSAAVKASSAVRPAAAAPPVEAEPVSAPPAPEAPEAPAAPADDVPDLAKAAVEDAPAPVATRAGRSAASKAPAPARGRAAAADSDGPAKPSASTGGRQRAAS
jgi:hypothetical protein